MQFLWRMSLFFELLRVLCVMGKYRLIWLSLEETVLEMSLNFDLITAVRTLPFEECRSDVRFLLNHFRRVGWKRAKWLIAPTDFVEVRD